MRTQTFTQNRVHQEAPATSGFISSGLPKIAGNTLTIFSIERSSLLREKQKNTTKEGLEKRAAPSIPEEE